jgi:TRAP transporter TAXI family solute receptor
LTPSGQRGGASILEILGRVPWSGVAGLAGTASSGGAEFGQAAATGRILLLVGHPSGVVRKALDACDTRIVPVAGAAIDRLAAAVPHFQTGTVPATAYGLPADVPSFGVRAVLVTQAGMADDVAYAMTRAILRNVDDLRRSHPALAGLTPQQMMKDAIVAPLHPGALRAYRDLGLTN